MIRLAAAAAPGAARSVATVPTASLAAEREAIRTAILAAPTWRLGTHWLGRQWSRMMAIEAEMRRAGHPQPG